MDYIGSLAVLSILIIRIRTINDFAHFNPYTNSTTPLEIIDQLSN